MKLCYHFYLIVAIYNFTVRCKYFQYSKIQRFIIPKDIIKDVWGHYTLIFTDVELK